MEEVKFCRTTTYTLSYRCWCSTDWAKELSQQV